MKRTRSVAVVVTTVAVRPSRVVRVSILATRFDPIGGRIQRVGLAPMPSRQARIRHQLRPQAPRSW